MSGTALLTLLVAVAASGFLAWVVGAGSAGATPFGPAVGANAISVLRAGFVVGGSGVGTRKLARTVLECGGGVAWVGSLATAFVGGYGPVVALGG